MKISTILDQIDDGAIALPVFQRGYVWNRNQVRGLMESLYRRHPVGSLLIWVTKTESVNSRGDSLLQPGYVKLLLDGQQRMTTLYGIIRGKEPPFFEGNHDTFTGLHFNMETEAFQFYAPVRMSQEQGWISVTELMEQGIGGFIGQIQGNSTFAPNVAQYIDRLNRIHTIRDVDLHVEDVTGEEKTVDIVVDIFNRVNSGGTKLSKGDLALAKICAAWPEARAEMNSRLGKWKDVGFHFKLEWLLRCVNSLITGEALFSALSGVETKEFRDGLLRSERHIDYLLNLLSSRLGLDHDRVLGSPYSFPLMVKYVEGRGGKLSDPAERDGLLYWYIHAMLWGRYSGSTETVLNQDLAAIADPNGGLDRLLEGVRRQRGDLRVSPNDFSGWSKGARFYPLLYMLTRVHHAEDWDSGIELSNHMLGSLNRLELHHIFPKSLLYEHGYERHEVNALANFTFLTQDTNLKVSNRDPAEYIRENVEKHPRSIESHWIPMDRELWRIENYRAFLEARRELLAQAANQFLGGLLEGSVPESEPVGPVLERTGDLFVPLKSDDEDQLLLDANLWVVDQGLPEGEFDYQLVDEDTGDLIAILDLAWPDGLQEGYSQPVALLIDEDQETKRVASQAGFRFYTDVESLKRYVRDRILAVSLVTS